ncbi:MAG: hypothetical protein IPK84_03230 [Candidatus Moraniibacteriota bacterium]|nr:MAG: hypothetical protein IPK84_03230 [Candidatus Moranbacteria bacterium]
MADLFWVLGGAQEMSESVRAWEIVRKSDEYAQEKGFLFMKNMAGRKGKGGGRQKSYNGRGVHVRKGYVGRRKMMKK